MKCYECKWLDRSVILTSNPPQYGCTLGFGSHYADHECEYDFMPIVRCKDCRHGQYDATHYFCAEHHHKVYEDDYCSHGQRLSNFSELAEQIEHKLPGHDEVIDALNKLTLRCDSE